MPGEDNKIPVTVGTPNILGEVGIDDALVMETKEEIFEMNNGCVCCTGVPVSRFDRFDGCIAVQMAVKLGHRPGLYG
eukprot:scaffold85020_cov48-Prasinocladus_malaysianus.AAC.1